MKLAHTIKFLNPYLICRPWQELGEGIVKKLIIIALIIFGLYLYFPWKPSTSRIAGEMEFGEVIAYQGEKYKSDWGVDSDEIEGYVRRKDRHFDKNMPIVTYDLVLTSGEYNDPDIVKIRHKGSGNYYWSSHKQPGGTLVFYHTIPSNPEAQNKLDQIDQGATVTLIGRISQNNEIRSDSGNYVKLMHRNHKFILVDDTFEK